MLEDLYLVILIYWGKSGSLKPFLLKSALYTWPSPIFLQHWWGDVEVQVWSTESAGHWYSWAHCQPGLQAEPFLPGNRLPTLLTWVYFLGTSLTLCFYYRTEANLGEIPFGVLYVLVVLEKGAIVQTGVDSWTSPWREIFFKSFHTLYTSVQKFVFLLKKEKWKTKGTLLTKISVGVILFLFHSRDVYVLE